MKTLRKILLTVVLILSVTVPVAAYSNVPYSTYTYNYDGSTVESPHAYVPKSVIGGHDLGIGEFSSPEDMCTDKKGNIYIADTANARVVVVSADHSSVRVINSFLYEDKEYALTKPTGLYVTEKGDLYVADSTGVNIYIFSVEDLICKGIIKKLKSDLLPNDFSYIPTKVAVDKAGRVYIVSAGNTYGVVALNNDGEFSTFVGAQKVTVSVVDKMWRKFMTKEQKKRTLNYVPTNYNNITIDEKGFLYVTSTYSNISAVINTIRSRSTDNRYAMIKKLNSSGEDVLVRTGAFPPAGDIEIAVGSSGNETNTDIYYGPSSIVDAAVGEDGVYALADQKRGKIFCYDSSGNLLYAFGGTGNQPGLFRKLAAIDYDAQGNLLALDNSSGKITSFSATDYGNTVQKAINLTANRKYDESVSVWREILLENSNFDLANIGIGTAMMREGNYKEAMRYFKLANDVNNYSESYSEYRREKLGSLILLIPVVIVVLCWLISLFFKWVKKFNDNTTIRADK
ncbi:MAG: NHL repeat-containing protein, partial [Lachnospiraceae bacterium]|nr:NHL repeat-containing protein [Lachnospiraceae bacterium]